MTKDLKIGEIIREHRKHKNISLRKLEEISNISFSHLSKIERGDHIPSKETIQALSKALEIDEYELLLTSGYSAEADMLFWQEIFNKVSNIIDKDFYYDTNGNPDVMKFRNNFVHGKFNDELSEKISEKFFEASSRYGNTYSKKSKRRFVDDVQAEVEVEYGEWFDFIDEMKKRNFTPEKLIEFMRRSEQVEDEIENLYKLVNRNRFYF